MFDQALKTLQILFGTIAVIATSFGSQVIGGSIPFAGERAAGGRFALLIGISTYKNGEPGPIEGCVNNVDLLQRTLPEWGFNEPKNVLILKNEQAMAKQIVAQFREHLIANAAKERAAGREPVTLFYFCGHGSQYPNLPGDDEENDGLDETFVAWDSRAAGNFDILDDEIADLRFELAQYTSKAVYVLDSCFSGTGTRNSPPDGTSRQWTAPDKRKREPFTRKFPQSKLAPDPRTYVEIAAAHSSLEAYSEISSATAPEKPYGLLTKGFVQALNAARLAGVVPTYRELIQDIRRSIELSPIPSQQSPQLEGDRDSAVFAFSERRSPSHIVVRNLDTRTGAIRISAGMIHGLSVGSQVAFYRKGTDGRGDNGLLATGTVKTAGSFESNVAITKQIDAKAKVDRESIAVVTSPNFALPPIYIELPSSSRAAIETEDTRIGAAVRSALSDAGLFENGSLNLISADANRTTASNARILRIGRGRIDEFFGNSAGRLDASFLAPLVSDRRCENNELIEVAVRDRFASSDSSVYFVYEGSQAQRPLFGTVVPTNEPDVSIKLANVIRAYTLQAGIASLDMKNSGLSRFAELRVETIPQNVMDPICRDGQLRYRPIPDGTKYADITSHGVTSPGTFIRLNLKNISGEVNRKERDDPYAAGLPLHFSLIALTNKGDVLNVYGSTGADEPLDDGRGVVRTFRVDRPATSIKFVLIVSRQFVDLSFLEFRGSTRDPKSIFERIVTRPKTRSSAGSDQLTSSPNDWGVIHYELMIKE